MNNYKNLDEFLKIHSTKDNKNITHTRIGNKELNIYGGKYNIPDEKINEFYKLYHQKVFTQRKLEFLTETPEKVGPILIDLDFRYEADIEEKQHSSEHIIDIVQLYIEQLQKLIEIKKNEPFSVFVLEKPGVNLLDNVTKDGIHIVIGINVDTTIKTILRENVLKEIKHILEELPLINTYEDVIDRGVSIGQTNWQLYGSCKPGHDIYKLTILTEIEINDEDELVWDDKDAEKVNQFDILKRISSKNKTNTLYDIKPEHQELYDRYKGKERERVTSKPRKKKLVITEDISAIQSKEDLRELCESIIDNLSHDEYNIKETHQYTMCLNEEYYEPYEKWIRVGWALHNTSERLFLTWMLFSSQSDKFSISDIETLKEQWDDMKVDSEDFKTYSERSIMYWAKQNNFEEYTKVKEQTVSYFMEKSLIGITEFDIATVIYQLYKDSYKCVSIKNRIWYEFKNGSWCDIDSGSTLRFKISRYVSPMYSKQTERIMDVLSTKPESDPDHAILTKYSQKYAEVGVLLKKTNYKNNIMRECCELFYEPNFLDKLDKNPYLLNFKNGVIDIQDKVFRKAMPDDYLSLSTHINYVPLDNSKEQVKIQNEIRTFFKQLFPIKELHDYMWDHLSSVLLGTNQNQTFNIYTGVGRNGKSKMVDLMKMVLGDYKQVVPITLVTGKRSSIGSLSPEVAKLRGVRYAAMQEPSKGDVLNDGIMKEITGGDPIQGRPLYHDTVTFVPQFSLVTSTNSLFDIKSNDDGTWRRIRVCEFMSKFIEEPDPKNKFHFKVDKKIDEKFPKWKTVFASMLIDNIFKTNGEVKDCDIVMATSNEYRKSQDYMCQYIDECIEEKEDGKIKKTEVWEEFKRWFSVNGNGTLPKPKDLYGALDKKLKNVIKQGWKGYAIIYNSDEDEEIEIEE